MRKILVILQTLLIVALTTSCTSVNVIKELELEKDTLVTKENNLKVEVDDLKEKNSILNDSKIELQNINSKLKDELSELDENITILEDSMPKKDLGITLDDFIFSHLNVISTLFIIQNDKIDDDDLRVMGNLMQESYLMEDINGNAVYRYILYDDEKTQAMIILSLTENKDTSNIRDVSITYHNHYG